MGIKFHNLEQFNNSPYFINVPPKNVNVCEECKEKQQPVFYLINQLFCIHVLTELRHAKFLEFKKEILK